MKYAELKLNGIFIHSNNNRAQFLKNKVPMPLVKYKSGIIDRMLIAGKPVSDPYKINNTANILTPTDLFFSIFTPFLYAPII
jgi:hypothetical protein